MQASVKLGQDTAHQMSSCGMILDWMQKNPMRCNHTNIATIAKSVINSGYKTTESAVSQALNKMLKIQMIYRTGGIRRSNFRINYLHKMIPGYILDSAPKEAQNFRNRTINGMSPDQHLDKVGCVVSKLEKEEPKAEEPKVETTITEEETPEKEAEVVSSDAPEENTVNVPVEVTNTGNGLSISITLNLNINK